ncbi:MAG TPA: Flp pilus assembly protein CpaB [Bacillota bacterium]|nr:Flp pilus assembly protein CpaB [Bacillota bacterium]
MSNKKTLILAIILGVLAVFLANRYLAQIKTSLDNAPKGPVLVAKTLIPAKTEVKADMYEIKMVPREYIHSQAITKAENLAGKITLAEITAGEQLLGSKFVSSKDPSQGLDYTIPKGKRAIAVGVNGVTGVADMVKPGNKVDVVAILDVDKSQLTPAPGAPAAPGVAAQGSKVPVSKMVLQDITVLAVDKLMDTKKAADAKDEAAKETKTLTLAVTPEEAEKLTLITERGVIRVILRSPVEDGKYAPKPYSAKDFLVR